MTSSLEVDEVWIDEPQVEPKIWVTDVVARVLRRLGRQWPLARDDSLPVLEQVEGSTQVGARHVRDPGDVAIRPLAAADDRQHRACLDVVWKLRVQDSLSGGDERGILVAQGALENRTKR